MCSDLNGSEKYVVGRLLWLVFGPGLVVRAYVSGPIADDASCVSVGVKNLPNWPKEGDASS